MKCIAYKGGYKYQLKQAYETKTGISFPLPVLDHPFITLKEDGWIQLESGYAWDGPSGPTIDTRNFMRGSLVHDALYQLMREKRLDPDKFRKPADQLIRTMCRADGMSRIRAWWVYQGLRLGGKKATEPRNGSDMLHAPDGCPIQP
jgi:hypothetical protein